MVVGGVEREIVRLMRIRRRGGRGGRGGATRESELRLQSNRTLVCNGSACALSFLLLPLPTEYSRPSSSPPPPPPRVKQPHSSPPLSLPRQTPAHPPTSLHQRSHRPLTFHLYLLFLTFASAPHPKRTRAVARRSPLVRSSLSSLLFPTCPLTHPGT